MSDEKRSGSSSSDKSSNADWVDNKAPTILPEQAGDQAATPGDTAELNRDAETLPPKPVDGDREAETMPVMAPGDTTDPSSARALRTKGRYFGDYELLEEIARGGMGVVYKARQVKLNRIVAVKMILAGQLAGEDDVKRFYVEAEAAANLQHPNIVAIYEVGEHDGQHYFSMDYVEGRSLADVVREHPLSPKQSAEYVKTIAEAIHFAHERGTLHRDLKPGNVLIDKNHNPRVTDFGLAKRIEADSELTATGTVLGTPSYMPPEQVAAKRGEVGPASDVYSLGAILYELITGRPPFQAESPFDTLKQVLDSEPVAPRMLNPKLPIDLETICLKCLQKEAQHRYSSARDLADELQRFIDGKPITARPISPPARAWRWYKRNPVVASLAAVALSLLFILGIAGPIVATTQTRLASQNELLANKERAARNKAVENLEEAQRQQALATKNLQRAHEVVDQYLLQVADHPKLKAHGLESLRHELLEFARTFYEEALDEQPADPELVAMQANTYFRLGRLTELVDTPQAALSDFEKGRKVYQDLVVRYPDRPQYKRGLAQALNNIGLCYRETGQLDEGQRFLEKSFAIRSDLVQHSAEDDANRMDLAQVQNNLALIAIDRSTPLRAAELLDDAIETLEDLLDRFPEDTEHKDRLARYYYNLGRAWYFAGKSDQSQVNHDQALRLRVELAEKLSGFGQVESDLISSYLALSVLALERRQKNESLELVKKARARAMRLVDERPDIDTYVIQLGEVNSILANRYLLVGQVDESIKCNAESIERYEGVLQKGRRPMAIVFQLAQALNDRGFLQNRVKQFEGVKEDYLRCVELGETMLREFPEHTSQMRVRSQVRLNLGEFCRSNQQYEEAYRWYNEAVEAAQVGLASNQDSEVFKDDISNGYYGQALVCARQDRYVEAVYFYDQAIATNSGIQKVALQVERTAAVVAMKNQMNKIAKDKDHTTAVRRAEQILAVEDETGFLALHAAALYDLAVAAAKNEDRQSESVDGLIKDYVQLAVEALHMARNLGYFTKESSIIQLKSPEAFQSIRNQPGFQDLLKSLENYN